MNFSKLPLLNLLHCKHDLSLIHQALSGTCHLVGAEKQKHHTQYGKRENIVNIPLPLPVKKTLFMTDQLVVMNTKRY